MMLRILAVALTGMVLCPASAQADQKAWRHLVYSVGVNVSTRTDVLVSGKPATAVMGNASQDTGQMSGTSTSSDSMLSKGTMTVDIIGLTADNALAVQVSEDTDNRKAPPVRVDVTSDGKVRVPADQTLNVSQEEQTLLRMLARNFLTAQDAGAGHWVQHLSLGYVDINEAYRIMGSQPDGDLTISVDQTMNVPGAQHSESKFHGTIIYSSKFKVPRSVSLEGISRREGIDHTETADSKLDLGLLSDSFQPRSSRLISVAIG